MNTRKAFVPKIYAACLLVLGATLAACSDYTLNSQTVAPTATVGITTRAALPTPIPLQPSDKYGKTNVTASLAGSGSTLAQPLYAKWFEQYKAVSPGVSLTYNGNGSGGGRTDFTTLVTDWGGSDAPLRDPELQAAKGGTTVHIPTAIGAVVATYNLPGVTTPLRLSGDTLARIYLGEIKTWNDPAIKNDNADANLPATAIKPVIRSDNSGTSEIFTRYLSVVSPTFRDVVGPPTLDAQNKSVLPKWAATKVAYVTGKNNDEVIQQTKANEGAIAYTEYAYAVTNKLPVASIRNQAGRFIAPSVAATQAAVAGAQIPDDFRFFVVNADSEDAYPIAGFTWIMVYQNMAKGRTPSLEKAQALANFLWWAIHDGQKANADLLYAPLPSNLLPRLEQALLRLTYNDQPLLK